MSREQQAGRTRPIFLVALPVGLVAGAFLTGPLFVATREPVAHHSLEGIWFAGSATLTALLLERHRTAGDRRALLTGTGFAVLAASSLALGILVPSLGDPYADSSYPFYTWQAGWLVAAVTFALGGVAPRWDPLRRLGLLPILGVALAALAALDLALLAAEAALPRFSMRELTSNSATPFALATTGQAVTATVTGVLLAAAAWGQERVPGKDRRDVRLWLAGGFVVAAFLQLLALARPEAYRPVVQPADAWSLVVLAAGFVAVLIHRRVALAEMQREAEAARDVARTRAELASMVAHELRNPLMSIKGLASTGSRLYETMSDEERREFFETIDRESARLKDVVSQTSTALKIDAGELRYNIRPEALSALVEEAVWVAALRDHPVLVEADPDLTVECDRGRIMEILGNLLSNAHKYSPPQSPIEVRAFRGAAGEAVVEVADRGPGIPVEEREHVFQKFARYRPPGYEGTQGAGLGLFISRAHVEAHGGRMWIDGWPGNGTIVRFTLPGGATT